MKIPSLTSLSAYPHLLRGARLRRKLSRRRFIGTTTGAVGGALGASLLSSAPAFARKASSAPTPIPGGIVIGGTLFHVTFFGHDIMPAVINNFNGFVGVAQVQGTGTGTSADGTTEPLLYDTDMRFMKGEYVGEDGAVHQGTFGFV